MNNQPRSPSKGPNHDMASPTLRPRAGFSMVEVIIAIVVLTVGVLGMAGTTAYIVRQITLADIMTERAVALQTVVERLQATPFGSVGSGQDTVGIFAIRWTSASESATAKLVTVITVGPGLATSSGNPFPFLGANVADTFQYRVISP